MTDETPTPQAADPVALLEAKLALAIENFAAKSKTDKIIVTVILMLIAVLGSIFGYKTVADTATAEAQKVQTIVVTVPAGATASVLPSTTSVGVVNPASVGH